MGDDKGDQGVGDFAQREADLTHKVYEAALDSSLWPEMIVSIVDHVNQLEATPPEQRDRISLDSLNSHFNRAYLISERMMSLQDRTDEQAEILGALACEVTLFGADDEPIAATRHIQNTAPGAAPKITSGAARGAETAPPAVGAVLAQKLKACGEEGAVQYWVDTTEPGRAYMLLPKREADSLGFPASASKVLLAIPLGLDRICAAFGDEHGLTGGEGRLLSALARRANLREAATDAGVSYETGRVYLKAIFDKAGVNSQAALMKRLLFSPAMFVVPRSPPASDLPQVRRLLTLADGRDMEYFTLGPDDGQVVLFFDAMAGSAIDIVGRPEMYAPRLAELNMRIITPCRPGGFRSSKRDISSLKDLTEDVAELCDALRVERASLLSYSYGSHTALAVAHELPHLVERITMSSVAYRLYEHRDWRDMDLFFQVTNIIGRRWPRLLERLLPFLARSILQNTGRFAERAAGRAKCDHERDILRDAEIVERTRAMLTERTANGMQGVVQEWRLNAQPYDFDVTAIEAPMLLLHGACDINNPLEGAQKLARDARNAVLHVLPGMGHHHIFREWEWIFAAAVGAPFDPPTEPPDAPRILPVD